MISMPRSAKKRGAHASSSSDPLANPYHHTLTLSLLSDAGPHAAQWPPRHGGCLTEYSYGDTYRAGISDGSGMLSAKPVPMQLPTVRCDGDVHAT